jgi:hypothetical protein
MVFMVVLEGVASVDEDVLGVDEQYPAPLYTRQGVG